MVIKNNQCLYLPNCLIYFSCSPFELQPKSHILQLMNISLVSFNLWLLFYYFISFAMFCCRNQIIWLVDYPTSLDFADCILIVSLSMFLRPLYFLEVGSWSKALIGFDFILLAALFHKLCYHISIKRYVMSGYLFFSFGDVCSYWSSLPRSIISLKITKQWCSNLSFLLHLLAG